MGDVRYDRVLDRLRGSRDARRELDRFSDEETIQALGAASKAKDSYWSNVLATEAENRTLRQGAILSAFGDAFVRTDAKGRIASTGGAAARLLGLQAEEAGGREAHAFLHPSCKGGEQCPLARVLRGRAWTLGQHGAFSRADGTEVKVGYRGFPLVRDGEPEGAALFFWDASEAAGSRERPRVPEDAPRVRLTFYVASSRSSSEVAAENLERLLARASPAIDVTTVDVERAPERAETDRVVATPMLRRRSASGDHRVVGDFAETDRVARGLEIGIALDAAPADDPEEVGKP